jgi:hypothetical protein
LSASRCFVVALVRQWQLQWQWQWQLLAIAHVPISYHPSSPSILPSVHLPSHLRPCSLPPSRLLLLRRAATRTIILSDCTVPAYHISHAHVPINPPTYLPTPCQPASAPSLQYRPFRTCSSGVLVPYLLSSSLPLSHPAVIQQSSSRPVVQCCGPCSPSVCQHQTGWLYGTVNVCVCAHMRACALVKIFVIVLK